MRSGVGDADRLSVLRARNAPRVAAALIEVVESDGVDEFPVFYVDDAHAVAVRPSQFDHRGDALEI